MRYYHDMDEYLEPRFRECWKIIVLLGWMQGPQASAYSRARQQRPDSPGLGELVSHNRHIGYSVTD